MKSEEVSARIVEGLKLDPNFVGFNWILLISILVQLYPILVDCFQPDDAAQAQEYVKKRYMPLIAQTYNKALLKGVTRRVKKQAAQQGMKLSWVQSSSLAKQILEYIRTSDLAELEAVIAENS